MVNQHPDNLLLWDAASTLIHHEHGELANAVLRKAIESSFAVIQQTPVFLQYAEITTPTEEQVRSLKAFDFAIRQALKQGHFEEAGDRYDQYIEALEKIFKDGEMKEMKKGLFGQLLKVSYETQDTSGLIKEPSEVYAAAPPKTFTTSRAAEILHVSDQTIRRMCESGRFAGASKTRGGHWRIPQKYFVRPTDEQHVYSGTNGGN